MTVIYTLGLIFMFIIMNLFLPNIIISKLRVAKFEKIHLLGQIFYLLIDGLLIFIFKHDLSYLLLPSLVKLVNCITEDRVKYMQRSPATTWLFQLTTLGVAISLIFLSIVNIIMIYYAYNTTATEGLSVQGVLGFEYAILLTEVLNITVKYILRIVELQSEAPWHKKYPHIQKDVF